MIKVIEAFAGVGSQRMALRNIGVEHEVVGVFEIDKYALQSYKAIHGDCPNLGDISNVNLHDIPDHDLFTYSFPCQDISICGKKAGINSETRSGLLYECKKIIKNKRPKYLLLENVKNLVGKKFIDDFNEWLKYLESLGYTNFYKVINAKNYGVPQNRERVFCVSILGNSDFKFPIVNKTYSLNSYLENDVDKKYFSIKQCVMNNIEREFDNICKYDGDIYSCKCTSGFQDNRVGIKLSPCLRANNNLSIVRVFNDGYNVRRITPLESWRLMGFKDEDFFKSKNSGISDTQLYKQAGNSIVVPILESIFKELFLNG